MQLSFMGSSQKKCIWQDSASRFCSSGGGKSGLPLEESNCWAQAVPLTKKGRMLWQIQQSLTGHRIQKKWRRPHSVCKEKRKRPQVRLRLYVDDIILTGDDRESIVELKNHLNKVFDLKETFLGTMKSFLGIEVARSKSGIFISKRKYTMDLLRETGKLGARRFPASSPITPNPF